MLGILWSFQLDAIPRIFGGYMFNVPRIPWLMSRRCFAFVAPPPVSDLRTPRATAVVPMTNFGRYKSISTQVDKFEIIKLNPPSRLQVTQSRETARTYSDNRKRHTKYIALYDELV